MQFLILDDLYIILDNLFIIFAFLYFAALAEFTAAQIKIKLICEIKKLRHPFM